MITSWLVIVIGDENEGPEKVASQIPEPLSNGLVAESINPVTCAEVG
ncbi:hypothetical protein HC766_03595 [Candidatus Gracilibacteria bacterium]|nr:hypothetical protein [Candidatus Gracilibacteria bacterium]